MKKNPTQITFARRLRCTQSDAEKVLWARLRAKQLEGIKFRRQQTIGPYIADLVSFERRLVIEVDGGQHSGRRVRGQDENRTRWLKENGYRVLRFWNNEVLTNMEGVLERIRAALE